VECLESALLAHTERSRAPDGDTATHVGKTGLEVEAPLEHEDDMMVKDGFLAKLVMDENVDVSEVECITSSKTKGSLYKAFRA
jgi:hypothetical protein